MRSKERKNHLHILIIFLHEKLCAGVGKDILNYLDEKRIECGINSEN